MMIIMIIMIIIIRINIIISIINSLLLRAKRVRKKCKLKGHYVESVSVCSLSASQGSKWLIIYLRSRSSNVVVPEVNYDLICISFFFFFVAPLLVIPNNNV